MFTCPVCGFDKLEEMPYDNDGNPSYEICICCGFEFGFDDDSEGYSVENYRSKWINEGSNWFSPDLKPKNWDLRNQLKNIHVNL
jgi:transcription elongation factor Elf1